MISRQIGFTNNLKLKIGSLTVDSLDFHINNYDILTAVYGERIDGIIGYSLLKRYIFKIDYDSSKIDIYSRGTLKYPKGGFLFRPLIATLGPTTVPLKIIIPAIKIELRVFDEKTRITKQVSIIQDM